MKNIQPTYATFEQAKMLKEKGFDGECARFYTKSNCKLYGIDEHGRYYPIKNKSKELWIVGNVAVLNIKNLILAPEQWQVVEWLRVNHGIWVSVQYKGFIVNRELIEFHYEIKYCKELPNLIRNENSFNSPQEAYSAAFDYILKELI
jgi:hypothetical protein